MSAIISLLVSAALSQSVTVSNVQTSAIASATGAAVTTVAVTTTTNAPTATTTNSMSFPTGIDYGFQNLSAGCQAAIQKYENSSPQGCNLPQQVSVTNITAGSYGSALSTLNNQNLDAVCSSTCQASIKPIASDIAAACKNDNMYFQYYSQLMTAFFDVACVKDGSDYCLVKEVQDLTPILVNHAPIESLIQNTTFLCSKCIYSQITVLDKDITSFPQQMQQEYTAFSTNIKSQCSSQYQKFTSSAIAQPVSLLGALSLVFIAFF
ncbi:hypothetical protein HK103_002146 [Boothiomyces macroporosus]|uniref:Uncharacterized protein n=1 Tax=Boothiomyces macroporosus TaxID=261099 RepID=A0AAD5UML0_9FUNG|nr:hypothetical protein HK103_002146 [Boothiomyces macroporosus]